ncbi:hypothetical protein JBE27_02820 [Streptomyces albiflaviniger]|nr:hypothetical protein [Streptomyces albiflaviniger]
MDIEDSHFVRAYRDKINAAIIRKEIKKNEIDTSHAVDFYIKVVKDIPQSFQRAHSRVVREVSRRVWGRRRQSESVKRRILKRYWHPLVEFDNSLAAAEFVNRSLVWAWRDWREEAPERERDVNLLGIDDLIGGKELKALLLAAMHAKVITLCSEISLLLRVGFSSGAASRLRTLYELTIKMNLIADDPSGNGYQLAERYFVSAQVEVWGRNFMVDSVRSEEKELIQAAQAAWGDDFFASENNWAKPVIHSPGKTVTFRQIEEAAGAEELRYMYIECNHAVHAGALRIIEGTDFRCSHLNNMRAKANLREIGRIGQFASFCLEVATMETLRKVTSDLRQWDYALNASVFSQSIESANSLFREGCGEA